MTASPHAVIDAYLRARAELEREVMAAIQRLEAEHGIETAEVRILRAPEVGSRVAPLVAVTMRAEL